MVRKLGQARQGSLDCAGSINPVKRLRLFISHILRDFVTLFLIRPTVDHIGSVGALLLYLRHKVAAIYSQFAILPKALVAILATKLNIYISAA